MKESKAECQVYGIAEKLIFFGLIYGSDLIPGTTFFIVF
jgi:hypothetical protein